MKKRKSGRKQRVGIIGTGKFVPTKVLTNADIEKMVDTSDEWITTRTGIKERRLAGEGIAAAFMGSEAAKEAIENAHLSPENIDLIITATITPDMQFPSTACLIQSRIGAVNADRKSTRLNSSHSSISYA